MVNPTMKTNTTKLILTALAAYLAFIALGTGLEFLFCYLYALEPIGVGFIIPAVAPLPIAVVAFIYKNP